MNDKWWASFCLLALSSSSSGRIEAKSQWLTVNSLLITYHGLVLLILLCDDGRFLVTRERVRNQIGYLVLNLVELLLGGLLELLDGFGARRCDLLGEPVLLRDVEAADAEDDDRDDDDEEQIAQVVDVANQVVDGAVEDEARPREHEHPHEEHREREQEEPRVRHLRHAVEGARAPAQPVGELRDED